MRFSIFKHLAVLATAALAVLGTAHGGWPVVDNNGSAIHCVNSTYGVRDYDNGTFHDGVDISMADPGDRVRAIAGGTVRAATLVSDIGYFIAIEESPSSWHYYWHMSHIENVTPAVGAVVSEGAVLGGQWTGSLGYHNHYSYFPHHEGTAPAARASRQSWSAHPFRKIDSPFGYSITDRLWWYGMPLKCHWDIWDYGYQFNGFRLIAYDSFSPIVTYGSDYPFKQGCCSDPQGDYIVGNGVELVPFYFAENACPPQRQPKHYEVRFDCLMHHRYQLCISTQPGHAEFASCGDPVANEEQEEIHAFVEDGTIVVVAGDGCSEIDIVKVEWATELTEVRRTLDMRGDGFCEPGLRSDPVGQYSKYYVNVIARRDSGTEFEREFLLLLGEIEPRRLAASPNPFAGQTEVRLDIGPGGGGASAAVEIFDLSGRLVKRIEGGRMDGFTMQWTWDGRDQVGRSVAAGVYLASVRSHRGVNTARIMKMR